jgi:hypothetical protein
MIRKGCTHEAGAQGGRGVQAGGLGRGQERGTRVGVRTSKGAGSAQERLKS